LLALAGQPHLGARLDTRGQFEVDRLAVLQRDPLRAEPAASSNGDRQPIGDIGALRRGLPAETAKAAAEAADAPALAAEQPSKISPRSPGLAAEIELAPPGRKPPCGAPAAKAERRAGLPSPSISPRSKRARLSLSVSRS
jgi:hypothetical protein